MCGLQPNGLNGGCEQFSEDLALTTLGRCCCRLAGHNAAVGGLPWHPQRTARAIKCQGAVTTFDAPTCRQWYEAGLLQACAKPLWSGLVPSKQATSQDKQYWQPLLACNLEACPTRRCTPSSRIRIDGSAAQPISICMAVRIQGARETSPVSSCSLSFLALQRWPRIQKSTLE